MSVFDHLEFDGHEQVAFFNDQKTGLQAIIAVHNTNLGPSLGGCRMWPYASSAEALNDVLRLSKGMTYKAAMAQLKLGGGKAVIIGDPRTQKSPELMAAMGTFVEQMGGRYITAEDSGIAVTDIKLMAQNTEHVSGIQAKYRVDGGEADGNPAPSTAYGVFKGLQASVKYALGSDLQGVKVAIQGMGHVGFRLAEHLHQHGAKLYVTDIYPDNVNLAVEKFAATAVAPDDIFDLDVDVYAPCAMGASVNQQTLSRIRAKVIAGAANNQLSQESMGALLRDKGILYAPDYVINAGGVIDIYHQRMLSTADAMRSHIEGIADTLTQIYKRAETEQQATNVISNRMAEERFLLN
ncbi:Glu/Leu/Phe/Val dehydrogenase dimerization domain-containing protein [Aliiglaciecola sp. 3_MG-2023]|uniref:Glu/Leu/Phe/Val dehydrogenase dimerization domain-containing protein n=1 Tax=Aliiglaciecola sp. 3_MG-2023 TaxID=3062644 RepID=UPI0026E24C08|nr:Glu/Leu/Phe/Val dehydrogenase dimerization domain-containing protein [Aliiglaciecola sp. 3_MG-2023]MDO6695747.1 Glu/Leu/Phe/Val dehydrogenase dimerization domain-containing protein [Aliiglaciecola sp. 3_MG-2023]